MLQPSYLMCHMHKPNAFSKLSAEERYLSGMEKGFIGGKSPNLVLL